MISRGSPSAGVADELYFAARDYRVYKVDSAGILTHVAGNLYIADANERVRRVDTAGIITTVAGNGEAGYRGDGGPAVDASLNLPCGAA